MQPAPVFPDDPGVAWIVGVGFRPAVWATHEVGPWCPLLVPAPDADTAYGPKYDGSIKAHAVVVALPPLLDLQTLQSPLLIRGEESVAWVPDSPAPAIVPLPGSAILLAAALLCFALFRPKPKAF